MSGGTYPNLEHIAGPEVSKRLCNKAGGLVALARLNDNALRHLGSEEFTTMAASSRVKQLHCGYLTEAPLFVDFFGEGEVPGHMLKAAQKALALLGRKCALAIKTDASGGSPDGSLGLAECEKLKEAFKRLQAEGKVSAVDVQALPVPEVHKRGEAPAKRRGGIKEFKKREGQKEVPGVLEKALFRVKMGVSEDQQREAQLESTELRLAYLKEQEKMMAKESHKRPRTETSDEYDDLLNIAL